MRELVVIVLAALIAAGCTAYDRREVVEWRERMSDRVNENSEEIERLWEVLGQGDPETAQASY